MKQSASRQYLTSQNKLESQAGIDRSDRCATAPSHCNGAWNRRGNLRLVDALYVELAEQLDAPIITTDGRLTATVPRAEDLRRSGYKTQGAGD